MSTAAVVLPAFGHRSFFMNDVLNIPQGFRGVVEFTASDLISAVAVKSEEGQLSTVAVQSFSGTYDFTVSLSDGRRFSGELDYAFENGTALGKIAFVNPREDDSGPLPVVGFGNWNELVFLTSASFSGRQATIFFTATPAGTRLSGTAVWIESGSLGLREIDGTFSATKRQ